MILHVDGPEDGLHLLRLHPCYVQVDHDLAVYRETLIPRRAAARERRLALPAHLDSKNLATWLGNHPLPPPAAIRSSR